MKYVQLVQSSQPYEATPIYKATENLLVDSHTAATRMPKQFRYGIGTALCEKAFALSEAVALACMEKNKEAKYELVGEVLRCAVNLLIAYRAAHRLNTVTRELYVTQVDLCVSVIKQAQGWQNKLS